MIESREQVRMPPLEPYNPFERDPLSQLVAQDRHLDELLNGLADYLSHQFRKWRMDTDFEFDLPQSQFDHKRDKPIISYIRPEGLQDEGMVAPLSQEQLNGIRQTGTFMVNSRRFAIPYKWKITQSLQLGRQQIRQDLYSALGSAFTMLYEVKYVTNIMEDIRGIGKNFQWMAMLYFGLRSVTIQNNAANIQYVLQKERQKSAFEKYAGKFNIALNEYLNIPIGLEGEALIQRQKLVGKRSQQLHAISTELLNKWNSQSQRVVGELEEKYPADGLSVEVERFQHELFINIVNSHPTLEEPVKQQLVLQMEQYKIINETTLEKNQRLSTAIQKIKEDIIRDFPIRRHCPAWFNQLNQKFSVILSERQQQWLYDQLKRKLEIIYFADYVKYAKDYDANYKRVQQKLGIVEVPTRTFYLNYPLFAPYRLSYDVSADTYSIENYKCYQIDTSQNMWKISLWWIRFICNIRLIFYVLVRNIWVGSFGLRVLFQTHRFYPDYIVNPTTGEIGRSPNNERTPIYVRICVNLARISSLRRQFEAAPNSDLFDKRTAKIFHLLHCYLVILFFKTIVYCCLLKPLLIILNTMLSIALIATMSVWLPILMLVLYQIDVILYNFDYHQTIFSYNQVNWFPVLRYFLRIFFTVLLIIFKLTISPLFFFTLSFICVIFAYSRYVCRTVYDWIMFILIKSIGRSPVTDSSVAWKIAGPGITGSYYQSIRSTDIYILVMAELEKIHLDIFQAQVHNLLQKPQTNSQAITSLVADRLKGGYINLPKIYETISFYHQKLYKQINERIGVFPSSPGQNVRFTDEEMLSFTRITKEIIAKYQQKYPSLDMFKFLNIRKRNENKLVKVIWQRIFQGDYVFGSLNTNEMRFDAMKEDEDEEVSLVANRIRTEAAVGSEQKEGITAAIFQAMSNEDQLISIQPKDCNVTQVISYIQRCSRNQLPSSKNDIHLSVILNPNIPMMQ